MLQEISVNDHKKMNTKGKVIPYHTNMHNVYVLGGHGQG